MHLAHRKFMLLFSIVVFWGAPRISQEKFKAGKSLLSAINKNFIEAMIRYKEWFK